ncbi:metallopeptidase family protein [Gryllotalpicola daejeonensis]|uniref:Metallopeptidase family protein n=1 Tax=Gryllotalpicola daejeonensis TaxID=993087 RepID=A0ABP7ZN83_9MICO
MPRSRRREVQPTPPKRLNRHGRRGVRGPVTGPHLPMLQGRIDFFEMAVASCADYLKGLWPDALADVRFEIAAAPAGALGAEDVERWAVDTVRGRITLFRVPIERLAKLHRNDELHKRMLIESCVYRAVAEYLGKDPWDLAPDRFRHF